jgi:large subunit ribosomal protein L19
MSDPLPLIRKIEQQFLRANPLPDFRAGDTVRVHVKIREGEKERVQAFEGVVIGHRRGGNRETFTVRKISYGVGVERVFATNSPNIDRVELLTRGKVRQSRLYFLRDLSGKAARIKERSAADAKAQERAEGPIEAEDSGKSAVAAATKGKKRGAHRKAEARTRAAAEPQAAAKKVRKPRTKPLRQNPDPVRPVPTSDRPRSLVR